MLDLSIHSDKQAKHIRGVVGSAYKIEKQAACMFCHSVLNFDIWLNQIYA